MALFGGPTQPVTRLEELKRLLQRDPTSRQFLALAEEYRRHGKYRDAVITLERGLALHQTSVAGHVALGKTYQQLDRLEDAIRAFTNALRIDRENLVAIRQLAEVYLAKGDKIEAIKKLKLYRGLKAGDRDVNDIIARLEERDVRRRGRTLRGPQRRPSRRGGAPGLPGGAARLRVRPPRARFGAPPCCASSTRTRRSRCPSRRATRGSSRADVRRLRGRAAGRGGARPARPPRLLRRPRPRHRRPRSSTTSTSRRGPRPPAPRASTGEIPPFTAPIPQVRDTAPLPAVEPPPPAAPFDVSPRRSTTSDDVPTAPFSFPVDLYRVGLGALRRRRASRSPRRRPRRPARVARSLPLVTPTLAALYENQGFAADARETWRTLAESEADEARARALREKAAALPAERRDWPHLRRLARRFPTRPEATANDLHAMIRGLVESTEGIRAATLTDLEGLPVVTAGPAAREGGQEILVAELTAFLKNVGRSASEVGAGRLRSLALSGANGTAVVSRVNDDYSLILHVEPDAILGEVRWEAERTARALSPAVR